MQSCPRPWVIMKLTISGVTFSAAADEIALVLAVFGVDDDDDFAPADRLDRGLDRRKVTTHGCSSSLNCRPGMATKTSIQPAT